MFIKIINKSFESVYRSVKLSLCGISLSLPGLI